MSILQKTNTRRFTGISTLFAYPFVRSYNRFNLQRSIGRYPSCQFTYALNYENTQPIEWGPSECLT